MEFKSANEGTWFYFDDKPELGGVCLRELTTDESNRITKLSTKRRLQIVSGTPISVQEEDKELSLHLIWDYCIANWKNIQLDGVEVSCTSENKRALMRCPDFMKCILDWTEKLVSQNKALEEARLKNLKSTSNGS